MLWAAARIAQINRHELRAWCTTSGGSPYLFHQPGDSNEPLSPVQWTRLVKACFKRHSGVPLAPKDLRASFITFLKSEEHDDETLKAAAIAMRHSSKTQSSAAYTKDQSDRLVAAAVRAAEGYAAQFD